MPVLPLDGSTRVAPGASLPVFSASSTIALAMRSLTLPVGFWPSSLAHRRTPGRGDSRGSPTRGVLPMASARSSWRISLAARDRGEDRDHVAVGQLGVERAQEADVLVVDVDVDEAVQGAVLGEQGAGDPRVAPVEVAEQVADGVAVGRHGLLAAGVLAQDRRDTDFNGHHGLLELVSRCGGARWRRGSGAGGRPGLTSAVAGGRALAVPDRAGQALGGRPHVATPAVRRRSFSSVTWPSRIRKARRTGASWSARDRIR